MSHLHLFMGAGGEGGEGEGAPKPFLSPYQDLIQGVGSLPSLPSPHNLHVGVKIKAPGLGPVKSSMFP